MSDRRGYEFQFQQIFQNKPEELWSQPFTERALQMHSLNTLDLIIPGGGLFEWYENPAGLDGPRTIEALREIGALSLSDLLSETLMRLEQVFGPRSEIEFDHEFDDLQIAEIRDISREFERRFREFCVAAPNNFYELAVRWWYGQSSPA